MLKEMLKMNLETDVKFITMIILLHGEDYKSLTLNDLAELSSQTPQKVKNILTKHQGHFNAFGEEWVVGLMKQRGTVKTISTNEVREVIDTLNKHAKTKYKYSSSASKAIQLLLDNGYTLEEIKKTVIFKCEQWMYTSMQDYLRPSTLFGSKFESYYNAWVSQNNNTPNIDAGRIDNPQLSPEEEMAMLMEQEKTNRDIRNNYEYNNMSK